MTTEKKITPPHVPVEILGCSVRCPRRIWYRGATALCAEDSALYSTHGY
jgi:hypothetical protein